MAERSLREIVLGWGRDAFLDLDDADEGVGHVKTPLGRRELELLENVHAEEVAVEGGG